MLSECYVLVFFLLLFYFILNIIHPVEHYNDRSPVTRYKSCHRVISYSEYCSENICIYDVYTPTRFGLYGSKNNNNIMRRLFCLFTFFIYSSAEASKTCLVQFEKIILKRLDHTASIVNFYTAKL